MWSMASHIQEGQYMVPKKITGDESLGSEF